MLYYSTNDIPPHIPHTRVIRLLNHMLTWYKVISDWTIYNPGKKLVDFFNFSTFPPSPIHNVAIYAMYVGK